MMIPGIPSSVRKKFSDTFNRSNTALNLGNASDGSIWKVVRGVFTVTTSKAKTTDAPSTYPIASIDMPPSGPAAPPASSSPVIIDLKGASSGTGAALWVTDSNNWFAVGSTQEELITYSVCQDCLGYACNTALQCAGFSGGNFAGYAGNNNATGTYTGNNSTGSYAGNNNQTNSYAGNNNGTGKYNACNNGFNCTNAYNARNQFCSGGYNVRNCRPPGKNPNTGGCPPGYNVGTCKLFSYNAGFCPAFNCNVTPPQNYNAGSRNYNAGALNYNAGTQIYNAGFANYNAVYCSGGFNVCNTGFYCSGGYNSYNCNPVTTYPAYIKIIKSVAGTISQLTSFLVTTVVNSLKITVSGNTITTKAYSDTNLSTQIGSDLTYTPTGAAVYTEYGIIVIPSGHNQTTEIDEISIERG
jgi:hypothetical protein